MYSNFSVLLVGGSSRNLGKTSLISSLIKRFSTENLIIALKIKTIYPNDSFFHGKQHHPLKKDEKYRLEEVFENSLEDSNKMLAAGANRAFKLKVKADYIKEAFENFLSNLNPNDLIVVESNSLRDIFVPDVFILIKHKSHDMMKPSAKRLQKYADKIILTDGYSHDFSLEQILIENNRWKLV